MPQKKKVELTWQDYATLPLVKPTIVMLVVGLIGTIAMILWARPFWPYFTIGYLLAHGISLLFFLIPRLPPRGGSGFFRLKNQGQRGVKKVEVKARCSETGQETPVGGADFDNPPAGCLPPGEEGPVPYDMSTCTPTSITVTITFEDDQTLSASATGLHAGVVLPPDCETVLYEEGGQTWLHVFGPGLELPEFRAPLD